jgi:MFS family permease
MTEWGASLKWRTLLLLSLAELLAMGLWFSASAVTPVLIDEWRLTTGDAAWLTMSVQIGFVVGALLSALFNVADIWAPRKVVAAGALAGAGLNALIPLMADGLPIAIALRFGTGMTLAAVYPVGMKIMATWTKEDRGLGLGLLVGALTIGSASPHFIRGLGGISQWEPVMLMASALAAVGGIIAWRFGRLGPYRAPAPKFRWSYMGRSLRERGLRLANFGYLGHMWELYAMWTWIPLFLIEAYRSNSDGPLLGTFGPERLAAFGAFAAIALGGPGSLLAGQLADRWGRARTTIASMVISGSCALIIGLFVNGHPTIVTILALVWGFAIVADSAQFSTSVSELGEGEYMGTLLTTQTMMGFLLTLASIRLIPVLVDAVGWHWAFATLAIGPALGSWAMWLLKRSPEAARLAGGRG